MVGLDQGSILERSHRQPRLQQPREYDAIGTALPSPHRSRDAYISAAHTAGIDLVTIKLLVNHRMSGSDVTEGYISPEVQVLRKAQETITRYLFTKCTAGLSH